MHLYAIVLDPPEALPTSGVDGKPTRFVATGELAAVVSDHEDPPRPTRAAALEHHQVVTALSDQVALAPVRFGVDIPDERTLTRELADRADALRDTITLVGSRLEFFVRATRPPDADPPATAASGIDYLKNRRDQLQVQEAVTRHLDEVDAAVSAVAVRCRRHAGPLGPERCYLVDRTQADTFVRLAARSLAAADGRVTLGGPLPPYTFADREVPA